MSSEEICQGCAQRHDCKSIYRTLGQSSGPSVVWKVVFVFLVPVAVFIISIAGFGIVLKKWIASEPIRTAVTFLFAVGAALLTAGLVRWLRPTWKQSSRSRSDEKTQNGNARKSDI